MQRDPVPGRSEVTDQLASRLLEQLRNGAPISEAILHQLADAVTQRLEQKEKEAVRHEPFDRSGFFKEMQAYINEGRTRSIGRPSDRALRFNTQISKEELADIGATFILQSLVAKDRNNQTIWNPNCTVRDVYHAVAFVAEATFGHNFLLKGNSQASIRLLQFLQSFLINHQPNPINQREFNDWVMLSNFTTKASSIEDAHFIGTAGGTYDESNEAKAQLLRRRYIQWVLQKNQ